MAATGRPQGRHLGRMAATGVLAASLAAGICSGPLEALASDATFTVEAKDNASASYAVYKIFTADMDASDDPEESAARPGIATHIAWASSGVKSAVLAFLNANGYGAWLVANGHAGTGPDDITPVAEIPQNAAEFIAESIGASPNDEDAATVPATKAARSFALELARTLDQAEGVPTYAAHANQAFSGEEGYYLFVTDPKSIGEDEAGTSPIWVPLGGATASITEKTSVPTVDTFVREDSTQEWGKAADANRDQDLEHRLVGTLPSNIGAFDQYHYRFTETLSEGLEAAVRINSGGAVESGVTVKIVGADGSETPVTGLLTGDRGSITYEDNVLVVDIADLKGFGSLTRIDKDATVVVEFATRVTDKAVIGAGGNETSVVLAYTGDPVRPLPDADATTLTAGRKTKTYTYELDLSKVDKQTSEALSGARFTVHVAESSTDAASIGKYVQADGSLSSTPHEFESDAAGAIYVPRIDEGIYTLRETQAPAGYELQDADITVAVTSVLDQATGGQTGLAAELSGGEAAPEGQVATHLGTVDSARGIVPVVASNDKKVSFPVTGLDGTSAGIAVAGGVLAISLGGLIANRRRASRPE